MIFSVTNIAYLPAQHSINEFYDMVFQDDDPADERKDSDEMERPVTPINDTIRAVPKTFSILCKHVRRRINPRPYWTHISVEDQRSLVKY